MHHAFLYHSSVNLVEVKPFDDVYLRLIAQILKLFLFLGVLIQEQSLPADCQEWGDFRLLQLELHHLVHGQLAILKLRRLPLEAWLTTDLALAVLVICSQLCSVESRVRSAQLIVGRGERVAYRLQRLKRLVEVRPCSIDLLEV